MKNIVFDMDGPVANIQGYLDKLVQYYAWFLSHPSFSVEDYKKILHQNYYDGIRKFCDNKGLTFPYDDKEKVQSRENKERLNFVKSERERAGIYPEMGSVIQALYETDEVTISLNTSAPVSLVEASIGSILHRFDYLAVGNNASERASEDAYNEIPMLEHRSKALKLLWLVEKSGVSLNDTYFVTDSVGDIAEVLDAVKVPVRNVILTTWGLHNDRDLNAWRAGYPGNVLCNGHTPCVVASPASLRRHLIGR